ncbi:hypothetical protein [Dielma fastidiosa]|jgi:hypothetical protein|uniref:hypothetical protein n=1 Tax=Dielma fastidiosa TaxID=1034346 RepID=UPI0023F41D8B|nr:hypothetical protein [Dielma fastidiosa]MBS6169663.1 hypothetical protein [Bacillota bacterium]
MAKKRTRTTTDGTEVCLFPMDYLRCTQGPGYTSRGVATDDSISHKRSWAIDNGGETSGRTKFDEVYAPVTMKLFRKMETWADANGVIYVSTKPVLFPNGEKDYLYLYMCHCEDISEFNFETTYKQGDVIYREGAYGLKDNTQVHVHMEARMKRDTTGPEYRANSAGAWGLFGNEPIQDLFFINGTTVMADVPTVKLVRGFIEHNPVGFTSVGLPEGWNSYSGNWYFVENKQTKTGWLQDNGGWYFLNDNRFKDYPYGAMVRDKWVASGNDWYFIKNGGTMAYSGDGGVEIDGKIYNFTASGLCLNPYQ